MKEKTLFWLPKITGFILGLFFIVFGEADDSPGLQGIGLIIVITLLYKTIKKLKK